MTLKKAMHACTKLCILAMLIVLSFSVAMAESDTPGARAYEGGMRLTVVPRNTTAEDSVLGITAAYLTCDHTMLTVGEKTVWTLGLEGPAASAYTFDYYLWHQELTDTSNMYNFHSMTFNAGTTFSATPNASGRYFVSVTVTDQYGGELEVQSAIYIAEDATTLADKVAEVVALCKASGCTSDYDIALFMHDYLIYNACYDETYTYYFPDGVLLYGTGVCQSYALAYQILMEEMGIDCLYVTGVAGGVDHSWNMVDIDGQWYQVDCTWDDPIMVDESGNVVPGGERHDYFCISDEKMAEDHVWDRALFPECGEYGAPAKLTITQQPVSVSVSKREMAVVTFTAKGDGLVYAWYFKNPGDSAFTKTTAFTENTYAVEMNETRDGRQVYCVVADQYGNSLTTDTVTISMKEPEYPESEHPYAGNSDITWTYTHPEEAYALMITFSDETEFAIEDYLYIISEDGTELKCTWINPRGNICLIGDSFSLRLTTDADGNTYGFAVTAIEALTKAAYEKAIAPRYTINASGVITGFSGFTSKIVIPSEVDGVKVTGIGDAVFQNNPLITSVVIPGNVMSIGDFAFEGCSNLTRIELSEGLTSIGYWAFGNCISLTTIDIPSGVTSIGSGAFASCDNLLSINLPDGVTSIGDEAFMHCRSLTTLHIPDSVTYMGTENTFWECGSLVSVNLPDCIASIGSRMFSGCRALESLVIPDNVTSIGASAFHSCYALTSINIPDGVTSIGDWAFAQCINMTEIPVPDSVTTIGAYAFYNCNSITSINIPDGVTRIENSAFNQCWSLTEIELPESVTFIGDQAFYNLWLLSKINIPDGVTSIGSEAFTMCSIFVSTTDLVIPPSVTSLGYNAFMPSNLALTVSQDSYAHNWCVENNLVFNVICATHAWAFDATAAEMQLTCTVCGHTKAVSFCIPSHLTQIDAEAFAGLPIQAVIVPEGCKSIGSRAFANCTQLLYVYIPAGTVVADDAFAGCSSVQIDIAQ